MQPTITAGASASAYTGRHSDLVPLLPALARFYAAFDFKPDLLGKAANDNGKVLAVIDRRPMTDEAYCQDLLRAQEAGKITLASTSHQRVQFLLVDGALEPRMYVVQKNAITHVWGKPVTQEIGQARVSKNEAAIAAEGLSLAWFCKVLRAAPNNGIGKTLRRRAKAPAIDWTEWADKVGGHVPLDQARAACGLPIVHNYPQLPCLPYGAPPRELFASLVSGRGPRSGGSGLEGDGNMSAVRRPDPDAFSDAEAILEHSLTRRFGEVHPEHFATLAAAANAGSMGDLVAANDNGTGKRKFRRAAEAWQEFSAA